MKRIIMIPVIVALLFFSCKKTEESRAEEDTASVEDEVVENEAIDTGFKPGNYGYALRVSTSFYILEAESTGSESDRVKWSAAMALGEKIEIGDARRLTFPGDGRVYDFSEIRRDNGSVGFAFTTQISEGGTLAVVTDEKANLYAAPRIIDVTGSVLPRKIVLVFFPDTERDGLVEVKAYDPAAQRNWNGHYVRRSSLSEKEADIQSSILLQTAEPLGNSGSEKNRKEALLEIALLNYPGSVFSSEIMVLLNPNTAAVIQTEPAVNSPMVVNDNDVNVRNLPDPVVGTILRQLSRDDVVTVDLQTVNPAVIDGKSARWYHITEPLEGWVFGAYLE